MDISKFQELPIPKLLGLLSQWEYFALFDTSFCDSENHKSLICFDLIEKICVEDPKEIEPAIKRTEKKVTSGEHAVIMLPYEAGFYFEPESGHLGKLPYPCFILFFRHNVIFDHTNGSFSEPILKNEDYQLNTNWTMKQLWFDTQYPEYKKNIRKIKNYIRNGDTYQVNYTIRCRFRFSGSVYGMYLDLRERQQVPYSALIRLDNRYILSFSPELFFRKTRNKIMVRPMKGTIKRGTNTLHDLRNENFLRQSIKNRAENLMIVDMMRNDLGRICKFGSVITDPLFHIEKYKTLFQMTSTVSGILKPKANFFEILKALFPSSSITGAPKIRTMQIINEIEKSPRKIYTGTIGVLKPDNSAVFNVAIRTIIVEKNKGEMGTGGGIVYDSEPKKEYEECLLKATFLASGCKKMQLIETMRWSSNEGYFLIDLHLERLKRSAEFFKFNYNRHNVIKTIEKLALCFDTKKVYRVRLLLYHDGSLSTTFQEIKLDQKKVHKAAISKKTIDSKNIFLFHKTTIRHTYDHAHKIAVKNGYFDVIFKNENEQITEGCITNVFIEKNGILYTPPVSCGLLPGVLRQHLINTKQAIEKILNEEDLFSSDRVFLGNSVRGLVHVKLVNI